MCIGHAVQGARDTRDGDDAAHVRGIEAPSAMLNSSDGTLVSTHMFETHFYAARLSSCLHTCCDPCLYTGMRRRASSYIVTADIVMAYIVMAYIFMA